jgi:hypothetical protein
MDVVTLGPEREDQLSSRPKPRRQLPQHSVEIAPEIHAVNREDPIEGFGLELYRRDIADADLDPTLSYGVTIPIACELGHQLRNVDSDHAPTGATRCFGERVPGAGADLEDGVTGTNVEAIEHLAVESSVIAPPDEAEESTE